MIDAFVDSANGIINVIVAAVLSLTAFLRCRSSW